jgi:hypothetical protein
MKILAIILIVIVALAGGAAAAVFMHIGPADKIVAMVKKSMEPPPPPPPPPPVIKNVGSFVIPLIDHRNISSQVGLDVAVKVEAAASTVVNNEMTALKNAFFLDLYDLIPRIADPKSDESKALIHEHLMKVAIKVAGENKILDVIIKSIYVR